MLVRPLRLAAVVPLRERQRSADTGALTQFDALVGPAILQLGPTDFFVTFKIIIITTVARQQKMIGFAIPLFIVYKNL